ncbi:hypothetical protein RCL_jg25735.t1 [Rhizophagus clarus]|uniref:Uncharacterized protein n=1 Tax=Rhizophagus clarus TaxID=94130 RepID=A0A8H3LV92_9GLOM|nr:hypothetical protein RCL_jg25735.t1 [Rhizophagus clarus]
MFSNVSKIYFLDSSFLDLFEYRYHQNIKMNLTFFLLFMASELSFQTGKLRKSDRRIDTISDCFRTTLVAISDWFHASLNVISAPFWPDRLKIFRPT